ncbi:MAG: hypothetical protein RIS43_104 [Actinomycetota bacterium]
MTVASCDLGHLPERVRRSYCDEVATSESGFPIQPVYGPDPAFDPELSLGQPGEFPFTRGIYSTMYSDRLWTMRQYAGFGTATETNARFRALIAAGTTGLSVAFDLPTQLGLDSDHSLAHGEVGRVGVAIDSIDDMRELFRDIALDQVSTSMTINAPAGVLLALYELVAEERGVAGSQLHGTIQNDVLKEYIARGTYIFPPAASMRFTIDVIDYCKTQLENWNTISISGYHMGEAGATPAQEVAFTIANAIEYVNAALARGMKIDDFAPRLAFFFVARTTLLEEVAKFRAARRVWARIMRDQYGATNPKSQMLRFHTQTAGVQLTAQQPEVNVIRVTLQALGAIFGGTQSLHTNSFDEALALPTEDAARLALRTQQVIAHETDIPSTVDPFAGSYAVEAMTDEMEARIMEILESIANKGGAIAAIQEGFQKSEIEKNAYQIASKVESGDKIVVGVNQFTDAEPAKVETLRINSEVEASQLKRLSELKKTRDNVVVDAALRALHEAATGEANVMPFIKEALRARASIGEVCDVLRSAWGTYQAPDFF